MESDECSGCSMTCSPAEEVAVVWVVVSIIVLCAVIGAVELRSWRTGTARTGDWQKGRSSPWPSGGTDRSTQPGKD